MTAEDDAAGPHGTQRDLVAGPDASTAVLDPPEPDSPPPPASEAASAPHGPPELRLAGHVTAILGALLLCFVAQFTLVGALKHERDQDRAHTDFRVDLANATAPVAALTDEGRLIEAGTPVAILEIPRLGVREVVGEGTSAAALTSGPGHLRSSVLPGQAGSSVILGRRAGYGGPFAQINKVVPGDEIRVTTGQGEHRFQVQGVRHAGAPQRHTPQPGKGGLTLVTADGPYFMPTDVLWVDAKLTSAVVPSSGVLPSFAVPENERVMASDLTALVPVAVWALVLTAAAFAVVYVHQRIGRWHAWVVGVPLLGTLGLTLADHAAALLPNLI